jgi:8-oxo-dGTP pyrophosphatase MutT (NUDIX family)
MNQPAGRQRRCPLAGFCIWSPLPMTPDEIAAALRGCLPGAAAQKRMIIHPRPGGMEPPAGAPPRESGVLVLLYPKTEGGDLHLPLILRAEDHGHHSGQVSFPGGAQEGEESITQTALREAHEEVGVPPDSVTVLGSLTPLYIPASGYRITPTVGYAPVRPSFTLDQVEACELIEAPLAIFMDDTNVVKETWHFGLVPVRVPFFTVGGHKVWGATAMVLAELAAVVKALGGAATPAPGAEAPGYRETKPRERG